MNANGISFACCALAAIALGACSGDSQPTGPGMGGTMLHDGYTLYSETTGEASPTYGDDAVTPTGGTSSGTTSEVTPYPSGGTDPSTGGTGTGETPPGGAVNQYPIEQFLASQGTFCAKDGSGGCASYMSPTANYLGWFNPAQSMSAAVDYAGLVNNWMMQNGRWIGSYYKGTVTESALSDGTARVVVQLNGDNVYAYVASGDGFSGKTIIGMSPTEYARPADALLGHLDMEVVYIAPSMGAPMPDLVQLVQAPMAGQRLESVRMRFDGSGRMTSTGTQKQVSIVYDGSRGPIYPTHPGTSEPTSAMGTAQIAIY
jgi:hypothetical protein